MTKEYNCANTPLKIKKKRLMTLGENIYSAFNQPIISIQNIIFTNQKRYNPIKSGKKIKISTEKETLTSILNMKHSKLLIMELKISP